MTYTLIHLVIAEAFGALLGFGVGLWIGIGHHRRVLQARDKEMRREVSEMVEKRLRKTTED